MKGLLTIVAALAIGFTTLTPNSAKALAASSAGTGVLIIQAVGATLLLSSMGVGFFAEDTIAGQKFGLFIIAGLILNESDATSLGEIDMESHLADLEAGMVYTSTEIELIKSDFAMLQSSGQAIAMDLTVLDSEGGESLIAADLTNQGLSEVTVDFLLNLQGVQAN